jgi:hypothetical protein
MQDAGNRKKKDSGWKPTSHYRLETYFTMLEFRLETYFTTLRFRLEAYFTLNKKMKSARAYNFTLHPSRDDIYLIGGLTKKTFSMERQNETYLLRVHARNCSKADGNGANARSIMPRVSAMVIP